MTEPQRYVWTVNEDPTTPIVGTIAEYAHHWELARALDLGVSPYVWSFATGLPVQQYVHITHGRLDREDFMDVQIAVGKDKAVVRIDALA